MNSFINLFINFRCSHYLNAQGNIEPFQSNQIDDIIKNVVEQMACEGLRTICVAYKDFEPKNKSNDENERKFSLSVFKSNLLNFLIRSNK